MFAAAAVSSDCEYLLHELVHHIKCHIEIRYFVLSQLLLHKKFKQLSAKKMFCYLCIFTAGIHGQLSLDS